MVVVKRHNQLVGLPRTSKDIVTNKSKNLTTSYQKILNEKKKKNHNPFTLFLLMLSIYFEEKISIIYNHPPHNFTPSSQP